METKYCGICKKEKPISEFGVHSGRRDGLQTRCKLCKKEYDKERYQNKKHLYIAASRKNVEKIRHEVDEYKSKQQCKKCEDKRFYVLDFHHIVRGDKDNSISRLATDGSRIKLWEEVEKCIVLCSNCHREFHYLEREGEITLEKYLSNVDVQ